MRQWCGPRLEPAATYPCVDPRTIQLQSSASRRATLLPQSTTRTRRDGWSSSTQPESRRAFDRSLPSQPIAVPRMTDASGAGGFGGELHRRVTSSTPVTPTCSESGLAVESNDSADHRRRFATLVDPAWSGRAGRRSTRHPITALPVHAEQSLASLRLHSMSNIENLGSRQVASSPW